MMVSNENSRKLFAAFSSEMDSEPRHEKMAANCARISGPMHLPCKEKLRSSALYRHVK
jgi:hypothetical protein